MISETIDKRCFLYIFIRIDMAIGILFVFVIVVTGLSKFCSDHWSLQSTRKVCQSCQANLEVPTVFIVVLVVFLVCILQNLSEFYWNVIAIWKKGPLYISYHFYLTFQYSPSTISGRAIFSSISDGTYFGTKLLIRQLAVYKGALKMLINNIRRFSI